MHTDRLARITRSGSSLAVAVALLYAGYADAQTAAQTDKTPAEQAGAGENGDEADVVVTGSRVERAGFDQPTPTTVIGADLLLQGQKSNLKEVLAELPQFCPSFSVQRLGGNTGSGQAPVDLRGLGINRTLTLLNGRRFVGNNNLNYVPLQLVERVEVVTGGASAAYGSDAIAGVVNIILKEKFEGLQVGVNNGISSRGDGSHYGGDITYGTSFGSGRGQFMVTGEYVKDESIARNTRRGYGSAAVVRLNPTNPADLRQVLLPDINFGNQTASGLITSGIFAGQQFNNDGTLRPYRGGHVTRGQSGCHTLPSASDRRRGRGRSLRWHRADDPGGADQHLHAGEL